MEEDIDYRSLRKIQQFEKNSPILTELNSSFYKDVSEYIDGLTKRSEKEESSQKQTLLKDEITNTKKIAFSIYEQREKKILLAAVSKARGGNPDLKNLLPTEQNLFDNVLSSMIKSRETLLKQRELDEEKKSEKVESNNKKPVEKQESVANNIEKNNNPVVRVIEEIPEFVGTDGKKYNLRKNDILSISKEMSEMLSKKNAVEKLELL